jgi:hypothetical protein
MQPTLQTRALRTIGGVAAMAAGLIAVPPAVTAAAANGAMPVAQQNELVQKYCAVCHTDATMTGGLSLEHFDAALPDPGIAAMLVSKLKDGAFGASGLPLPDVTTRHAFIGALSAEAAGAREWIVSRTQSPMKQAPILTASIVQEVPSSTNAGQQPDLYRLKLTCHVDTHVGEIQLAWSPGDVPATGGAMSAALDGKAPSTYQVANGEGAAILYSTQENSGRANLAMPLPEQSLTIRNLFPNETVVFPFGSLAQTVRQEFATCFGRTSP